MKRTFTLITLLLLPLAISLANVPSYKPNNNNIKLEVDLDKLLVDIYPNPSSGKVFNVNISGVRANTVEIRIYSLIGSVVYEKKFEGIPNGNFQTRITPDRQLAQGIYLLSVTTEKASMTKKLRVHN